MFIDLIQVEVDGHGLPPWSASHWLQQGINGQSEPRQRRPTEGDVGARVDFTHDIKLKETT
ncbi:hypothetical protein FVF58_46820 [Paraburkholderia panacisoli]|uniref:Uncharacterized protein n=1 Tax=Paraburkholderia panacisoli TaxID=2603818 RepID=A0A5B0G5P0_9BURK|nr:hypothetical protein [Paraburkholderia panacisoli]KAA0997965.1 hypothetical protein FVF58_46820 [Paraburkholderia panacisoli]